MVTLERYSACPGFVVVLSCWLNLSTCLVTLQSIFPGCLLQCVVRKFALCYLGGYSMTARSFLFGVKEAERKEEGGGRREEGKIEKKKKKELSVFLDWFCVG